MRAATAKEKQYTPDDRNGGNPGVILCLGMSRAGDCGVRDYGRILAAELEKVGHQVKTIWMERPEGQGWLAGLKADARLLRAAVIAFRRQPAAAIFHYSPFTFGAHGVPILAPLLPLAGRLARVRVTSILHEIFFPWRREAVRGFVWALSQRLALVPIVLGSASVIVTREDRRRWLVDRLHVKESRISVIPVWSNIQVSDESRLLVERRLDRDSVLIGSFGWGSRTVEMDVVLDALSLLKSEGVRARFLLIGGPGPHSKQGRRWQSAAEVRGVSDALRFTGAGMPPDQVSRQLSDLDVYIHADSEGLSPGRTSLAAALQHGIPVVAFRTPGAWKSLREGQEVLLSGPEAGALKDTLHRVIQSEETRSLLHAGALNAYIREMDPKNAAKRLSSVALSKSADGVKKVKSPGPQTGAS